MGARSILRYPAAGSLLETAEASARAPGPSIAVDPGPMMIPGRWWFAVLTLAGGVILFGAIGGAGGCSSGVAAAGDGGPMAESTGEEARQEPMPVASTAWARVIRARPVTLPSPASWAALIAA